MKRTIGNKLNDYKHLKPPGSEFVLRLVMIRRAANVVFRRNRYAWLSLKKLFVQRMKAKHPEAVKNGEEVIRMEETTVTGIYCYPEYNFPITLYECNECGAVFLDRDDDYKYCPYCGRKITKTVN